MVVSRTCGDALSTGVGYLMMADTSRFTYDATTGSMLTANNRYANVHRSYYPNGAIRRDSSFILNGPTYVAGNSVTVGTSYQGNTYGLTKQYSLDGKDSVLAVPGVPSGGGNVVYTYRTDNGALATVTDPSGNWFRYTYDGAGRVDSLLIGASGGSKSIWETHVYDWDGRQTRRIRATASAPLFDESFWFDAQGRPIKVGRSTLANGASPDTSRFIYSGLGAVQARERIDQLSNWESEEYRVDALGNNVESRDGAVNSNGVHDPRYWQYTFHGELTSRNTLQPQQQNETFLQQFDADGNVSQRFLLIAKIPFGYDADDQVRNYYDAANRLRATQHYLDPSSGVDHGTFDEYEYDALGRRIVVISRRNDAMPACHPSIVLCIQSICNQQATCSSSLTRYAWDGNQTLVEDRQPFGSASYSSDDGYVTYVHGAEIDRPLGVIDTRVSGNLRVPHPTWRGMYESSSTASGAPADCSLTTNTCAIVAWNATNSLYKLDSPSDAHVTTTYTWVGGLLINDQDATGFLYRRNRYYDPVSGRFTQEDPIGLDGGLNTYGFGEGDPVNYSDPFGLCALPRDPRPCSETWNGFGYAHGGWLGGHVGLGGIGKIIDAMEWTYHHSGAPADEKVEPAAAPAENSPPSSPPAESNNPPDTPKNPDGSHKERGQQYEEISEAQRRNRQRGQPQRIERTEKSRQRDRQETRDEAEEALEQLRRERKNPPKKEEEKKP